MIFLVDGRRHEVALQPGKEGLIGVVDGQPIGLAVEAIATGTFLLRHGDHVETFHCVRDGGRTHLAWKGVAYVLEEEKEGARATARPTAGGLEAPMPGKVLKVSVAVGDSVVRGQEVLVVEAMKMENTLRAPRDGRVRAVAVQVGDRVSPGTLLVDLE